jgi:ClpP class serine protease
VTKADLEKSKEDIEQVLGQFSSFVKQNRPSLDIDAVATGETWFGNAALERGLCDEIKTVDDILLNYVDLGYNVYEIEYSPPPAVPAGLAQLFPAGGAQDGSLVRRGIQWAVGAVIEEVRSTLDEKSSISQRYIAKDDTSDRVQARD